MPLKPAIHRSIAPQAVTLHTPHEFREFVLVGRLDRPLYTVISYPGMRSESSSVVTSRSIKRAIAEAVDTGEPLIAIAHNFTAEAIALLEAQGAIVFRRHDYHWTDETYAAIHR
jgi:hypothetical protein